MSRQAARELDRALAGSSLPADEELAELVEVGERIRTAYMGFTPGHSPQRAMFVRAVADRARPSWSRFLAPATITAVLLIGLLFLGRTALPGGAFYPVRQVLRNVGLAPASVEEAQELLDWADRLLDRAEAVAPHSPEASERLAFEATRVIGMAEGALEELEADERSGLVDDLADVLGRAKTILTEEPDEDADRDADGKAVFRDDDEDEDGDTDGDDDSDPSSNDRSGDNSRNRVNAGPNSGGSSGPNGGDGGDDRRQNDDTNDDRVTRSGGGGDDEADDQDDEDDATDNDGKSGGDDGVDGDGDDESKDDDEVGDDVDGDAGQATLDRTSRPRD